MFNAGTEQFMPDWRAGHVSVVVRDSRMREHDPILGMVFLKVQEFLALLINIGINAFLEAFRNFEERFCCNEVLST